MATRIPPRIMATFIATSVAMGIAAGCSGGLSHLPEAQGFGPQPVLPEPDKSIIPTINVVKARGWSDGESPIPPDGAQVTALARDLQHPRWLYVLPNGDVLVAETNAPERPDDGKGIKGWFFKHYQKKAGGAVPSANRITLLRDRDADGIAELRSVFVSGLRSPFGMELVNDRLYIANSDSIVSFPYTTGATTLSAPETKLTDLPAGPLNHHWTKNIVASPDATKLYAAIGSNSNVAENGIDVEIDRAQIWEVDLATGTHRVFASGLRNPVGMAWAPASGALWVAVNERDELGDDLVPDYITSVRDGGFYGWPYSYFGAHVDDRVKPQRPDLVATAIVPDYALGAHTASLGLAFAEKAVAGRFARGMFIGQHGSWNREPRAGYKVIFVPFDAHGRPAPELPQNVLSGFTRDDGTAMGRPVGVGLDRRGNLLVADDVGNAVWRVQLGRSDESN